jgi:hypothetical protein
MCAVLCVADDFVDIALWGWAKLGWLRGFLRGEADIPSYDTFGRVFGMFDAQEPLRGRSHFVNLNPVTT